VVSDHPLPAPSSILYLAGDSDYLAWTSVDLNDLYAVKLSTGSEADYKATPDLLHRVQFPVLVGDYAVWYTGDRFSIMDMTSGRAFDINGSASGANGMIAVAQPDGPVTKGQISRSRISTLVVSQVPHMLATGCS
jgi:hypothetical protein